MVSFPNCKINIGLRVTARRADGFHDIESIFYPVPWRDAIEVIQNNHKKKQVNWSQSGLEIPGFPVDNLCLKAYNLIKNDFPDIPGVSMHLHKEIPMGAGLGGGSADAAFMIKLLNDLLELRLADHQLLHYALQLGSDCPFFISNKPSLATGRGEILEEIQLDLSDHRILIVNPAIHINTGQAFSNIEPRKAKKSLKELIAGPIASWQKNIHNEFEKPVFREYPEIATIKASLIESGSIYASMSGSGSSVFGIYSKKNTPILKFPSHYYQKWV